MLGHFHQDTPPVTDEMIQEGMTEFDTDHSGHLS
jgi:Ca2+-binding EF-hand superfamily protein